MTIRILNAALDEITVGDKKVIVIRGVVHADDIGKLSVDDYQREPGSTSKGGSIWQAFKSGSPVPDIELGMRGDNFMEDTESMDLVLHDKVFVIDGLQRCTVAKEFMEHHARDVRLGATIHLNTTKEWERERFRILNTQQARVSPNVLLRNLRETNRAVLTLYGLSKTKEFPLYGRVSWGQNMARTEIITAATVLNASVYLHKHLVPVNTRGFDIMAASLERIAEAVTLQQVRDNIQYFFALIEECWGITNVQYSRAACWLRGGFLYTLARLLSDHTDFWRGNALFVNADLRRKIKQFPVMDPMVVNLAGQTGAGSNILYAAMLDHINKGKSTNRLIHREKLADELEEKRKQRELEENGDDD